MSSNRLNHFYFAPCWTVMRCHVGVELHTIHSESIKQEMCGLKWSLYGHQMPSRTISRDSKDYRSDGMKYSWLPRWCLWSSKSPGIDSCGEDQKSCSRTPQDRHDLEGILAMTDDKGQLSRSFLLHSCPTLFVFENSSLFCGLVCQPQSTAAFTFLFQWTAVTKPPDAAVRRLGTIGELRGWGWFVSAMKYRRGDAVDMCIDDGWKDASIEHQIWQ